MGLGLVFSVDPHGVSGGTSFDSRSSGALVKRFRRLSCGKRPPKPTWLHFWVLTHKPWDPRNALCAPTFRQAATPVLGLPPR